MHGKHCEATCMCSERIQKKPRNVSSRSFLQDDVDRLSSVLPTPVNIVYCTEPLSVLVIHVISPFFIAIHLASLALTTEVDEIIMLSLSRTLLASFVPMIIGRI